MRRLPALAALAVLLASGVAFAQPDLREQARRHFAQGVALFESRDYDAALAEFEAAQRIRPHPRILRNVAASQEALHMYIDAIATLERVAADAQATPAERREAEGHLRELRALLARIELIVEPAGAEVLIDDHLVGTAPLPEPVPVASGMVRVVVRMAGYRPEERSVRVAAGGAARETFTLAPLISRLHLDSNAAGARVRIGEDAPRDMPVDVELPPGTHVVRTEAPGFSPDTADVVLQPGEDRTLTVVLERPPASLRLRVAPAGARVLIDGDVRAQAGTSTLRVEGGPHRVRIEGPDLIPWEEEVHLEAGQRHTLRASLGRDRLWVRPVWFWGGVVTTTAIAVAATITGSRVLVLDRQLHDTGNHEDLAGIHEDRDAMVGATDALLVGAVATSAATLVFYLLSRGEPPEADVTFR